MTLKTYQTTPYDVEEIKIDRDSAEARRAIFRTIQIEFHNSRKTGDTAPIT